MHELSLCKHVIEILEEQAIIQHYKRVKKVYLEIGVLANIEKSAFAFSFDVVTKNTIAEGAELEFIDILGQSVCEDCGKEAPLGKWGDVCVECGSHRLMILRGEEFRIQSVEVE